MVGSFYSIMTLKHLSTNFEILELGNWEIDVQFRNFPRPTGHPGGQLNNFPMNKRPALDRAGRC